MSSTPSEVIQTKVQQRDLRRTLAEPLPECAGKRAQLGQVPGECNITHQRRAVRKERASQLCAAYRSPPQSRAEWTRRRSKHQRGTKYRSVFDRPDHGTR